MSKITKTLKAVSNKSKRTYTLRCYAYGIFYAKYRTLKMSQEEYDSAYYWTENDWRQFLKTDEYYVV